MSDEVWQLDARWILAARASDAPLVTTPPAGAFFDATHVLGPREPGGAAGRARAGGDRRLITRRTRRARAPARPGRRRRAGSPSPRARAGARRAAGRAPPRRSRAGGGGPRRPTAAASGRR